MSSSKEIPRVRREHRSEAHIGRFITEAAADADNRVLRAVQGPPPTNEEKEILATAPHEQVRLYCRVAVTDLEFGEQQWFTITEEGKGDLARGEISLSSPIGRALLMEYPGSVVAVKAPGGTRFYRILRVEP
jgi:transcription elongation GreA/GreB family factor